jgi:4'-phosphopantetheinyl transferase EntD
MTLGRLAGLLPEEAVVVETLELTTEAPLYPVEAERIAAAARKRRLHFAGGRRCAREALGRVGLPSSPIRVGFGGQPVWPKGVVGSITHCPGYCAAAVAPRPPLAGLGIDAERNAPLPDGVAQRTTLPGETADLPVQAGVSWPTLLFSARESVFKAWYPLTCRWLDHHDVELQFDVARRCFTVVRYRDRLIGGALLERVQGGFAWSETHVFTCAWIESHALSTLGCATTLG